MKKNWKRLSSLVLALALLVSMIPLSVSAEEMTQASLQEAINNAQPGQTISVDGEIVLSQDLVIPVGKDVTLSGTSETAYLHTSGEYTILVEGSLTLKNLKVGGKMDQGYAPVTLTKDHAVFYGEAVSIENTGASASGFDVSAQGIQIASGKKNSSGSPQNCTVELVDSSVYVDGAGARGICFAGKSEGTKVTLNHTTILNGENAQTQWQGGYSRGIALWNAANMEVLIQNDSQIAGFQYAINSGRQEETNGLKIIVQDSDLRGWTTFNVWTDGGLFQIENSTLTGMNGSYNGDKIYSFSSFVINRDIYNNGSGIAENNRIIIKDSAMHAITEDNQPVETLLRIDVDSTEVQFQGEVTFTDSTGGKAGAVFDIGNMDDPTAFIARHENLINQATILTPDGNPVFPVYEVMNTFGDGEVTYGQSFKTFIGGVDYEGAAAAKEKVILLRNVNEPEFAVNEEEGHGNQFGGWTLDLAGYTLTLAEWSGDKIKVIDSSPEKTGDIIVNGESVIAARKGENCYTSLSAAIAAASAGETVTLLKDTEESARINITKNVVLDLGGNILTSGATHSFVVSPSVSFEVKNGTLKNTHDSGIAIFGLKESTITLAKDASIESYDGIIATNSKVDEGNATINVYGEINCTDIAVWLQGPRNTVNLDGANLTANYFALYQNGSFGGAKINIQNSTLVNGEEAGPAIYISNNKTNAENQQQGYHNLTVENSTIVGSTGIEVKYTNVTVENSNITATTEEPVFDQFNNGSTTAGFAVVATDNSMEPDAPAPECTIDINGGYYTGLIGLSSLISLEEYPDFKEATYTISGGYFSHDPSAYLPEELVAVVSDKAGYNYMVAEKTSNAAEVVVAEPNVPAPDLPDGATDKEIEFAGTVKNALTTSTAAPSIDTGALTAAANEKANENTLEKDDPVVTEALKKAEINTENENITIVIQPYLEIVVKDVAVNGSDNTATLQAITLDVTPMYRTVATTADLTGNDPEDIILESTDQSKPVNAAQIGEPKELTITKPVTVTIPLPSEFADGVPSLYVKHVKDNGRTYYYTGNVADDVLTFDNPNGFSLMTISKVNEAVAEINGVGYGTLQEALADAADGDTVKILKNDLTASMSGSSRTITLQNEAGANITVTINGEVLTIEEGKTLEYTYTRPGGGSGGGTTEAEPFEDVDENDWFYDEVVYVYANGLMQGTSDTTFSPKNEMDRAMLVTTLYRMEGEPSVADVDVPFTDVTEGYYVDAVAWAYANDIVSGYENNTFQPKEAITREQYVTILHRYAQFKGMDVSSSADLSAFTDADKVSGWAEEAMIWAVDTELMQGVTETTIAPRKTAQRCQGAALLTRFHQMMA